MDGPSGRLTASTGTVLLDVIASLDAMWDMLPGRDLTAFRPESSIDEDRFLQDRLHTLLAIGSLSDPARTVVRSLVDLADRFHERWCHLGEGAARCCAATSEAVRRHIESEYSDDLRQARTLLLEMMLTIGAEV